MFLKILLFINVCAWCILSGGCCPYSFRFILNFEWYVYWFVYITEFGSLTCFFHNTSKVGSYPFQFLEPNLSYRKCLDCENPSCDFQPWILYCKFVMDDALAKRVVFSLQFNCIFKTTTFIIEFQVDWNDCMVFDAKVSILLLNKSPPLRSLWILPLLISMKKR